MNVGRIQAQGGGTEKSSVWNIKDDCTKEIAISHVDNLESQLTPAELRLRVNALIKSRNRILNSPIIGLSAVSKKSFYDDFQNKSIRIDVEVLRGVGFVDERLL